MFKWSCLLALLSVYSISSAQNMQEQTFLITYVTLEGNKITRDNIILRELEFVEGKSYSKELLDSLIIKSRQNLLNRSLFNFVEIKPEYNNSNCSITVSVIERWYIWPIPTLSFADPNFNVWWQTKDFNRLNYGLTLNIENFRGRMENLYLIAQGGYDRVLAVRWKIPYLTKRQYMGIGFYGGYSYNHEVAYQTVDNKREFYNAGTDFARYSTFGQVGLTFRPKFNYLHSVNVSYNYIHYADTLLEINPSFTTGKTTYSFPTFQYQFKLDFRDSKQYPLNGYYFDVGIEKTGLGLIEEDINFWSVGFAFDQYLPLYKKLFFAYNLSAKFTNTDGQPYFLTNGLGYNGLEIRGYELYVVDGQRLGVFKSNLKYQIIKQTDYQIKWIKSPKFGKIYYALYANIFFDLGYASDNLYETYNPLANQLLWGAGFGLDLVSYYDIVLRLEYGINKQGETGFFLGLVAPI